MKKLIGVLTVILIITLGYAVYLGFSLRSQEMQQIGTETETTVEDEESDKDKNKDKDKDKNREAADAEYERLMSRDLENNYPASYLEVMVYYTDIIKYLYSGDATEEQIANLIDKERQLYAKDILLLNTYEDQVAYAMEDIAMFTQNDNRILEAEVYDIFETSREDQLTEISVKYLVSKTGNIDMQYYLVKEGAHWKILSFKATGTAMTGEDYN